jgi:ABC-type transport system involved in multi-copper enzyme maturation permease subunit
MREILKKEILENITTYRFGILAVLLGLLMAVSTIISISDYRSRLENYSVLSARYNAPEKIMLPPNPLSLFARGVDPGIGRMYSLSTFGVEVEQGQESANRLFALFTLPDMLFIIRVVLALCALLFSFDAICGEKELGTLRLILAGGASRSALLAGKLLGRFALVMVPFAFFYLLNAAVLSLLPDVPAGSSWWGRVAFVLLTAALYAGVFTALGCLVSASVHRSATSLALGLSAWAVLVFVVPALATTCARALAPVPPAERVDMEGRLASIQAIFEGIQRARAHGDERDFAGIALRMREVKSRLMDEYRPRLAAQNALARDLARCSPAGAVLFLITESTNTGLGEDVRLKEAIARHLDRNFDRLRGAERGPVEHFAFRERPLAETLTGTAGIDLLLLAAFAAGCAGMCARVFLRYDPR